MEADRRTEQRREGRTCCLLYSPKRYPQPRQSQKLLPSFSAQALATAEFGVLLPGMVAQPPFSMSERRSQDEEILLNATSFAAAWVCCWNFATQIGASTATAAVSGALGCHSLSSTAECPSER